MDSRGRGSADERQVPATGDGAALDEGNWRSLQHRVSRGDTRRDVVEFERRDGFGW